MHVAVLAPYVLACCTHRPLWQAVTFDRVGNTSGAVPEDHADFVERLTHLLSLLHALALQHLRGDWHLSNLVTHDPSIGPPPVVRGALFGFLLASLSLQCTVHCVWLMTRC